MKTTPCHTVHRARMLCCGDTVRENGRPPVPMTDDWKTIYGDGVHR